VAPCEDKNENNNNDKTTTAEPSSQKVVAPKTTSVKAAIALASPPPIKTKISGKRSSFDTPLTANGAHFGNGSSGGEHSRTSSDDDYLKIIQVRATAKDSGLEKKLHGGLNHRAASPTYGSGSSHSNSRSGSAGRRVHSVKPLDE
jgi:hypothetical protein